MQSDGSFRLRHPPRRHLLANAVIVQAMFSLIFSPVLGGAQAGSIYWFLVGFCGFWWLLAALQFVSNFKELEFDATRRRLIWRNTLGARFGRSAVSTSVDSFRSVRTVAWRRQYGFALAVELLAPDGIHGMLLYHGDGKEAPRPGESNRNPCAYETDQAYILRSFLAQHLGLSDAGCVSAAPLACRPPKNWFTKC